jgi:hypothetical protein
MTFPKLPFRHAVRRSRLSVYFALPLVVALSALTACDDDPVEPEEPEIGTVRLVIGTQTLNVTGSGTAPAVTISGASTLVTATFLDEDGAPLTLNSSEFEIRLVPATSGRVTFTRTGPFTGTLTRVAAGTTLVAVSVFHLGEGHDDFGPHNINLTVQ